MKLTVLALLIAISLQELQPKSGNLEIVEDSFDIEPSPQEEQVVFEDNGIQLFEELKFLRETKKKLQTNIKYYRAKLDSVINNVDITDQTEIGSRLTELLGEDYKNMDEDFDYLKIKVKAQIEKIIGEFFLFKCVDKFTGQDEKAKKCIQLKNSV